MKKTYKRTRSAARPKTYKTSKAVVKKAKDKKKHGGAYMKGAVLIFNPPSNLPIPQRFKTKFTCAVEGYVAAGAFASKQYNMNLNQLYLPFNSLGTDLPATFAPAPATVQATGATQLLSALGTTGPYTKYRVLASSIEITALPQVTGDSIILTVTPSASSTQPSDATTAQAQAFTKRAICTFAQTPMGDVTKRGTIKNYCNVADFLGVTQEAIENDLSGNYQIQWASGVGTPIYWTVNYTIQDATNQASSIMFSYKLNYWVELFGMYTAQVTE